MEGYSAEWESPVSPRQMVMVSLITLLHPKGHKATN